jgi:hypothetical protein
MSEHEQMLEAITRVQVHFDRLGLTWQHPRVLNYLAQVERITGRPCPNRHYLCLAAYINLADRLTKIQTH